MGTVREDVAELAESVISDQLLTPQQVADILNVRVESVQQWMHLRQIPYVTSFPGMQSRPHANPTGKRRARRIPLSALDAWINSRRVPALFRFDPRKDDLPTQLIARLLDTSEDSVRMMINKGGLLKGKTPKQVREAILRKFATKTNTRKHAALKKAS